MQLTQSFVLIVLAATGISCCSRCSRIVSHRFCRDRSQARRYWRPASQRDRPGSSREADRPLPDDHQQPRVQRRLDRGVAHTQYGGHHILLPGEYLRLGMHDHGHLGNRRCYNRLRRLLGCRERPHRHRRQLQHRHFYSAPASAVLPSPPFHPTRRAPTMADPSDDLNPSTLAARTSRGPNLPVALAPDASTSASTNSGSSWNLVNYASTTFTPPTAAYAHSDPDSDGSDEDSDESDESFDDIPLPPLRPATWAPQLPATRTSWRCRPCETNFATLIEHRNHPCPKSESLKRRCVDSDGDDEEESGDEAERPQQRRRLTETKSPATGEITASQKPQQNASVNEHDDAGRIGKESEAKAKAETTCVPLPLEALRMTRSRTRAAKDAAQATQ
ncbi:hypothetical protein C8F01DRAFT_1161008 [Mycena amicta]|nr:hypothetical protein C8F01DRAFT_1161008 [Mycena amicta]